MTKPTIIGTHPPLPTSMHFWNAQAVQKHIGKTHASTYTKQGRIQDFKLEGSKLRFVLSSPSVPLPSSPSPRFHSSPFHTHVPSPLSLLCPFFSPFHSPFLHSFQGASQIQTRNLGSACELPNGSGWCPVRSTSGFWCILSWKSQAVLQRFSDNQTISIENENGLLRIAAQ